MKTFESKAQKGFPNDQKSITFIDNSDMPFRHVEKPYKPNEQRGFSKANTAFAETLIKPVENEDFVSQKSKKASE